MKRLVLTFLIAFFACAAIFAQDAKTVAVYVTGKDSQLINQINVVFISEFYTALVDNGEYKPVERNDSFLEQLASEISYQTCGAVEDSTLSRIGKQIGAAYVCVVEVTEVMNGMYLSAKLISTETALVEKSKSASSNKWETLEDLARTARSLSKNLFPEKKAPVEAPKPVSPPPPPAPKPNPNDPKRITINFVSYEVMPYDLDDKYTWHDAKSACDKQNYYGHTDWRLPTENELVTMIEWKYIGLDCDDYWTSLKNDNNQALVVCKYRTTSSGRSFEGLSEKNKVRCIRNNK